MPRITIHTVLKLLIASLCVGMLLAFFNLSPQDIISSAKNFFGDMFANMGDWVQWAVSYVLLGAVVVVPIWLVSYLWRASKGKGG